MKHDYTNETIQTAIDATLQNTDTSSKSIVTKKHYPNTWKNESKARLTLARELLERLPEPTPPAVDGKTPGELLYNAIGESTSLWENLADWYKFKMEECASAVLAAFGGNIEAAIARMEAVPQAEILNLWNEAPWNGAFIQAVRSRLIAAARDGQGEVVDWKAQAETYKSESENYKRLAISWKARAENAAKSAEEQAERAARFEARAEKAEADTFESHDKVWQRHTPGDDRPCEGRAKIDVLDKSGVVYHNQTAHHLDTDFWTAGYWNPIIGWRYADQPTNVWEEFDKTAGVEFDDSPPWTPKVGDTVKLKSGGPVMVVRSIHNEVYCNYYEGDSLKSPSFPLACLEPATKEEQV